ncbi:tellurite resistance protein TehB [Glycocaulis alkaliphilus]|uniref:Tellurite resistance protein TehB n=1 Tax=Glycocaulis alkaliphilus TaxID=1434191 RepID=A0A3T0E8T3_9PROT|nr:class I SAM-dependent methyltransferase [Glycocaulis alkaliphilus]AZU03606.1 tellurite resistance protein TehB [Glycocaulis alkaliphilus]GGB82516.1 SAM-dependent methyltransferase [Glycocaulis alkaliphilus]
MTEGFTTAGFWDARYQGEDYAYGRAPNDFLRLHSSVFPKGARILSLAEGEGRNAVFLAEQGYKTHCVDFSPEGQKKTLQLAKVRGVAVTYDIGDLTAYGMGKERWDGIISIFCHLSQNDRPGLYASVARALKPGGVFLLEAYHPDQIGLGTGGPRDAAHLLRSAELEDAFAGFEILVSSETVRHVEEGAYHQGQSAVTQFIARKPG